MEASQKKIRLMHYIGEFLNLDFSSFDSVAEFIALIQALREGLTNIDDYFALQDFEVNVLFLSKLETQPEWKDWALTMLRDKRVNSTDPAQQMTFQELSRQAIKYEKAMLQKAEQPGEGRSSPDWTKPRALTQDEINEFVTGQMHKYRKEQQPQKGHTKRPSQEEINEFVVQQMRKEQERKTRSRARSQPDMRKAAQQRKEQLCCTFCGDRDHRLEKCWRRWRVVAEMPRANYTPKRVEFKREIPGQRPIYHGGFTVV
ncbi:hypothetical protein DTO217A2_3075 [Paecilomyces variotii]|nr:hypothetical protein DTO217A2_3075 [Paecilomyces variotii]